MTIGNLGGYSPNIIGRAFSYTILPQGSTHIYTQYKWIKTNKKLTRKILQQTNYTKRKT